MNQNIIDDLKAFDWQTIIDYGNSLDDLNHAQLRFAKGSAVEQCTKEFCNTDLVHVAEKHRDFEWPKHDIDVELKSIFSQRMYDTKGNIKTLPSIRLNNSMGTNKETLDPNNIADVFVVAVADGAFAVSKKTVLDKAKHLGDGWELRLTKDDIVELSGCVTKQNIYDTHLAESFQKAIQESLPKKVIL